MTEHEALTITGPAGYRAIVSRVGGKLQALSKDGKPLVEDSEGDLDGTLGAGRMLAPWPNRLDGGKFTWKGTDYQFPVTEADRNNALHGLVFHKLWDVAKHSENEITLTQEIEQWPARIEVTYSLSEKGLRAEVSATTTADSVPFAWGWHPYFSALGAPLDECFLDIETQYNLVLDSQRMLPTGEKQSAQVVLPAAGKTMEGVELDHAFKVEPATTVALRNQEGKGVAVTLGDNLTWVQMYTPLDFLGRGRSIAIEPMSAPPNALKTGMDVFELTPENPFNCHVTISEF